MSINMLVIPNFIGFNSSRMVKVKTKAEKALLLPVPQADQDVAATEVQKAQNHGRVGPCHRCWFPDTHNPTAQVVYVFFK